MIAYDRLQNIIPPDQALACKALQAGLQQIAGIADMTLTVLANTANVMQSTKDLPLVIDQTSAVPPSIANYYTGTLATGTGTNGTLTIMDIIGLAAGWKATDTFANTVATFNTMNLVYLNSVYSTMSNVVNGNYGNVTGNVIGPIIIPPGQPAAGEYATPDEAFIGSTGNVPLPGLIPVATTEIINIGNVYPTQVSSMNTEWNAVAAQILSEASAQAAANLVWAQLQPNSKSSIYSFIFSLPSYGQETKEGGVAQFIELVADTNTFAGQSVVTALRQGKNQQALSNAGVGTITTIPANSNPPEPDAVLIPSVYSETEAANAVIK